MNRERIQILRDHLASLPDDRFDIRFWFTDDQGEPHTDIHRSVFDPKEVVNECGTAACIGGWAFALFMSEVFVDNENFIDQLASLMALTVEEAGELFMPDGHHAGIQTREDAIRTLDHLLETGEVVWS